MLSCFNGWGKDSFQGKNVLRGYIALLRANQIARIISDFNLVLSDKRHVTKKMLQKKCYKISTYLSGFTADNTKMRIMMSRLSLGNGKTNELSVISHTKARHLSSLQSGCSYKKKTISTLQYGNENSDGSKYHGWKMPVCVLKVQISTIQVKWLTLYKTY